MKGPTLWNRYRQVCQVCDDLLRNQITEDTSSVLFVFFESSITQSNFFLPISEKKNDD